jgi:hypothetical protein
MRNFVFSALADTDRVEIGEDSPFFPCPETAWNEERNLNKASDERFGMSQRTLLPENPRLLTGYSAPSC